MRSRLPMSIVTQRVSPANAHSVVLRSAASFTEQWLGSTRDTPAAGSAGADDSARTSRFRFAFLVGTLFMGALSNAEPRTRFGYSPGIGTPAQELRGVRGRKAQGKS